MQESTIELELEVETYDIDAAGHANNIAYVRWLEDLRTRLVKANFDFKKILADGCYVVVASTTIKYKKPLKLFDRPVGRMTLSDIRHGVMIMKADVLIDGQLASTAEQKCVMVRLSESAILNEDQLRRFLIIPSKTERSPEK